MPPLWYVRWTRVIDVLLIAVGIGSAAVVLTALVQIARQ
jgi:hypothetical protein